MADAFCTLQGWMVTTVSLHAVFKTMEAVMDQES